MLSGILSGSLPGVALIHKGDFDRIARGFLDLLSQFGNLGSLLFVGRGDMQSQQVAQGINCQMHFAALFTFMTIVAGSLTAFGLDCRVRPSKIAADGCAARPAATRNSTRKSWTMASNTPAASQRCVC